MSFVTRFAPSPTGLLHRGHAFSALMAFGACQRAGGRFLIRLEDIDTGRVRPAFEAAILEDCAWLGLRWETPVRRQSEHLADYADALARLQARGVVYRCFSTRREILDDIGLAPHDPAPPYTGAALPEVEEARLIHEGRPFAWRLSLEAARRALGDFHPLGFQETGAGLGGESGWIPARPEMAGDVVLARKDLGVAYHLAVVVDDAIQGVSHVIRGADLFQAAHIQRLIQALLGLPTPIYQHHPLILRPDGKRFAKRDQAETLRDLRAKGVTAANLRAELGL